MTRQQIQELYELLTEYCHYRDKEEHIEELTDRLQYDIMIELKSMIQEEQ